MQVKRFVLPSFIETQMNNESKHRQVKCVTRTQLVRRQAKTMEGSVHCSGEGERGGETERQTVI